MKRGQFNFWWLIVGAIVILIVAASLLYIFGTRISGFQKSTESCTLKGGACKVNCGMGEEEIKNTDCTGEKPTCCVGV